MRLSRLMSGRAEGNGRTEAVRVQRRLLGVRQQIEDRSADIEGQGGRSSDGPNLAS